jgi:hypothetical protein
MTLTTKQLLQRLYFDRTYTETACLIGYQGIDMSAFWEQAKAFGIPQGKLLTAVYDLTRGDRREEKPARYDLTAPARDACWMLLGPPPGHPLREELDRLKEPLGAEESHAEKAKKARKLRSKGR